MSLKYKETNFDEYVNSVTNKNLHPKLDELYNMQPNDINSLSNFVFYGPGGTGKYSQVLYFLKRYSEYELKYEKKMSILLPKSTYNIKMSDIHYEIDFTLLGCNSKILWHEIYSQIVDSILAKKNKVGIIVCKYFHCVHNELLEIFYSYMQNFRNKNIKLSFIFITEQITFIPDNILNCCHIISVQRPSKTNYYKCIDKPSNSINLQEIESLKYVGIDKPIPHKNLCENIYLAINNYETLKFNQLRESLYNILIYDMNVIECIWYIFSKLIENNKIPEDKVFKLLCRIYSIIQRYNNNYRPIMHLESFIFSCIDIVHGLSNGT